MLMIMPTNESNNPDKANNQVKEQSEVENLNKLLPLMLVKIEIQRAEAIQLIQADVCKQYEKLEKCFHAPFDPS